MWWADPEAWVITSRLENSQTFYTFSRWEKKKGSDRRKLSKEGTRGRREEGERRKEKGGRKRDGKKAEGASKAEVALSPHRQL